MSKDIQRRANGEATRRQILGAIGELTRSNRRPPTYREITDCLGITMGSLTYNLRELERSGKVRRHKGTRGLELPQDGAR
jgi:predicted transcriptional regulator